MNRNYIEEAFKNKFNLQTNHFKNWKDNLIDEITPDLFEVELRQGDGSELDSKNGRPAKFSSITSSSALGVNTFSIWKKDKNINFLNFDGNTNFRKLEFERKFPNGLHGNNPNLDVVLESDEILIAVECKFLEPLTEKSTKIKYSKSYFNKEDSRNASKWYSLMQKIDSGEEVFKYLDAVQLTKHFYGLCNNINKKTILYYLFWEDDMVKENEIYLEHKRELDRFKELVVNDELLEFKYLSYQDLWKNWLSDNFPIQINNHAKKLIERFSL